MEGLIGLLLFFIIVFGCIYVVKKDKEQEEFNKGYDQGYDEGYMKGYQKAKSEQKQ